MSPNIEQAGNTTNLPKEFDSIKNQAYFLNTYKKLKKWYGEDFNDNEINIIKEEWTKSYNGYNKYIDNVRAVIIANRIDKGIFVHRYPDFKEIDETIIRQIPSAEMQRDFRDIAITIEEKFQKLSEDEITIIKNEFLNRKNKGKLPNADKIAAEITEYRLNNTAVTNFGGELSELENIITNPSITNTFHPSNDIGDNNDTNKGYNNIESTQIDNKKKHREKHREWPAENILQGMEQIKLSPNFQDLENKLFNSNEYNWDKYGNEKYVKYFFRESMQFLESCDINEIDDNTLIIIERELQLISTGAEYDSDRLKRQVIEEMLVEDEGFIKFKKILYNIHNDVDNLHDDVDEEIERQMKDAELKEEIRYLEENGISGEWYRKAKAIQQIYTNKLKKGEELSEAQMILLKKLNIILGEDGKAIGKIIKLRKIKQIQKNNESKKFDGRFKTPQFEQVEGNIKSLPDTIVHNNQSIHDYVFRKNDNNYTSFDGEINDDYKKILYNKLKKLHENDAGFMESIKYLDEYGNINHKKVQAENIDEKSLQENVQRINEMINDLAEKEFHEEENIEKVNEVCIRKSIITTCFRALSNYFDTTNNNGENFADSFEIGDINEDISFDEETGIIKMKGKIGGNNIVGLYYDTKKGELLFDNFIGYNSNVGYIIGTNNGEKEKINIKLPTMDELETQANKVDKHNIFSNFSKPPKLYIETLSKCINESLWLGCFQGFIGTEMDVNRQFVKEFNEKNILKQEIFRSIYSKYYNQDMINQIVNDKLVISEGNEKEQYKLIKLVSDSIDNCKNSNELLMFRNLITEFDKLVSQDYYVKKDNLLQALFSNNLNDEDDAYDQSIQIMKDENTDIVVNKDETGFDGNTDTHTTNKALNYYTFLDLLAEDKGVNRIIDLSVFDKAINTIKTDGAKLLDKSNEILWKNYGFKVIEGNIAEIVPVLE